MVGDVDHGAAHVVALVLEPLGFLGDALGIDVEHGHARAIVRQRFGKAEPEPARAARDDDAIALHLEQVRDLHEPYLRSFGGLYRARRRGTDFKSTEIRRSGNIRSPYLATPDRAS